MTELGSKTAFVDQGSATTTEPFRLMLQQDTSYLVAVVICAGTTIDLIKPYYSHTRTAFMLEA